MGGAQKGAIARFTETGVVLADGSEMDVDLVVFGTGFTKTYGYLGPALRERLNRQSDGLYLYRNMFPMSVPDLCFVGSEVSTFNNILTQGLQALAEACAYWRSGAALAGGHGDDDRDGT